MTFKCFAKFQIQYEGSLPQQFGLGYGKIVVMMNKQ